MSATTHSAEKKEFQSTLFEKRISETRLARVEPVPMPAKGPGLASGYIGSFFRANRPQSDDFSPGT